MDDSDGYLGGDVRLADTSDSDDEDGLRMPRELRRLQRNNRNNRNKNKNKNKNKDKNKDKNKNRNANNRNRNRGRGNGLRNRLRENSDGYCFVDCKQDCSDCDTMEACSDSSDGMCTVKRAGCCCERSKTPRPKNCNECERQTACSKSSKNFLCSTKISDCECPECIEVCTVKKDCSNSKSSKKCKTKVPCTCLDVQCPAISPVMYTIGESAIKVDLPTLAGNVDCPV